MTSAAPRPTTSGPPAAAPGSSAGCRRWRTRRRRRTSRAADRPAQEHEARPADQARPQADGASDPRPGRSRWPSRSITMGRSSCRRSPSGSIRLPRNCSARTTYLKPLHRVGMAVDERRVHGGPDRQLREEDGDRRRQRDDTRERSSGRGGARASRPRARTGRSRAAGAAPASGWRRRRRRRRPRPRASGRHRRPSRRPRAVATSGPR